MGLGGREPRRWLWSEVGVGDWCRDAFRGVRECREGKWDDVGEGGFSAERLAGHPMTPFPLLIFPFISQHILIALSHGSVGSSFSVLASSDRYLSYLDLSSSLTPYLLSISYPRFTAHLLSAFYL